MPFTISHAAAVLPFSRLLARQRLLSAALIGAMVPDFGVFFPWRLYRVETHSVPSLLTFCLPVGLVSYWIFQYLIKVPVTEVLPEGAYARWHAVESPADPRRIRQWLLAACGVLAGAATHLIWDGFTHEGARGVRMFPSLDDTILEIGRRHVAGVGLLQDLSSLMGLLVVLALVAYGLRRGRENPLPGRLLPAAERRAWILAFVAASVGLGVAFHVLARFGEPPLHSVVARAYDLAVSALRGLAAALVIVSLILGARLRALRYRSSGPER